MARKRDNKRKGGRRKIGRSQRPVRWPLMPDRLTVRQAWHWFNTRYER